MISCSLDIYFNAARLYIAVAAFSFHPALVDGSYQQVSVALCPLLSRYDIT